MEMMTCATLMVVFLTLLPASPINAQNRSPPAPIGPTPTPAPAPAPEYVNLTDLLSVAGPFHVFLGHLQSTKVIDTFQNQANNTDHGITIFVPKDTAFSSLRRPISNLTQDQLKSLLLSHALPQYYALSDFNTLSRRNPVATLAGGGLYALNFTDNSGTILISSGWTKTTVSSAVHAAVPVAIYQVNSVLLPEALFGTDIPPTPAPAPAPEIAPAADVPGNHTVGSGAGSSFAPAGSARSAAPARVMSMMSSGVAVVVGLLLLCWF